MKNALAFYIGSRYTRTKRRNGFISFISMASMLGIALGVMVLITVLSVMNGFDYQISNEVFAMVPQVTVLTHRDIQKTWPALAKEVAKLPKVTGVAPFATGQGMLVNQGQIYGVEAMGIDPSQEAQVSQIGSKMIDGKLSSLTPGSYHVIVGQKLANNLGVEIGDKLTLFTPQSSITLAGIFPRYKQLTVSGIFHASGALGFETDMAYMNMSDVAQIFPAGKGLSGLRLKVNDLYGVGEVRADLYKLLPSGFGVTTWIQSYGAFFQALWMEKTILFAILLLIVAVATFNLVSTLVMVVNDKRADIAILRTLGASPGMIMKTFIVQGMIVGIIGILIGLVCGLLLAHYITGITDWIQSFFHVQLINESVIYVSFLPSRIEAGNVFWICLWAFILSLLATLYPAWSASKTQPAEALRYE